HPTDRRVAEGGERRAAAQNRAGQDETPQKNQGEDETG
ncbi:MAG: hypothetical protein JWR43_1560, partial [Phenylobacterium sp.]|nr:hypothetical protein [Phenylobacterium sp.]